MIWERTKRGCLMHCGGWGLRNRAWDRAKPLFSKVAAASGTIVRRSCLTKARPTSQVLDADVSDACHMTTCVSFTDKHQSLSRKANRPTSPFLGAYREQTTNGWLYCQTFLSEVKCSKQQRKGMEMAQGLRELTVFPEDPGSIPRAHKVAHDRFTIYIIFLN